MLSHTITLKYHTEILLCFENYIYNLVKQLAQCQSKKSHAATNVHIHHLSYSTTTFGDAIENHFLKFSIPY